MSARNNTPEKPEAPTPRWKAAQGGIVVVGFDAVLRFRCSSPIANEPHASLLPEVEQKKNEFKASAQALRYAQLLAEIPEAERLAESLKNKASRAAIHLADTAMATSGDALGNAQADRDLAMTDWRQAQAKVETLREAAASLRDVLNRQLAEMQDKLRTQIGGEAIADKKQIADEAAARISDLLDKMARLGNRQTRGSVILLPNVDQLIGSLPPPADAPAPTQPRDYASEHLTAAALA